MSTKGDWIANCLPDRAEHIADASVYRLQVGPPRPNQMQKYEDLVEKGMVGLYRLEKKDSRAIKSGQKTYLQESDFKPAPGVLLSFLLPSQGGG